MCPLIHLATTFAYSPCVRRACVTPRIQSSPPCVRPPRPCARFRQPRIPLLFQEKNGAPVARGYEHPSPVIPGPVRINCILFEKPLYQSQFLVVLFLLFALCSCGHVCISFVWFFVIDKSFLFNCILCENPPGFLTPPPASPLPDARSPLPPPARGTSVLAQLCPPSARTTVPYTGSSSANQPNARVYDAEYNAELNPNKEQLSKVNRFNQGNSSLFSATQNMCNLTNKAVIPDQLNPNFTKRNANTGNIGAMSGKNVRENAISCGRNQPDVLNAFNQNPYSKPLNSIA